MTRERPLGDISLDLLVRASGRSKKELWQLARRVLSHYRHGVTFSGSKPRELLKPSERLKAVQKTVRSLVRERVEPSPIVTSVKGVGIEQNAGRHLGAAFVSTRDLSRAFPSVRAVRVDDALAQCGMDADARALVRRLVTYRDQLPQGAPTSNVMLDLVLAPLDGRLLELASNAGVRVTRYVDDFAFSAEFALDHFMPLVEACIAEHGMAINVEKTRDFGAGERKVITGLILGDVLKIPSEFIDDTARSIARAIDGDWVENRSSILGRIKWIERFDGESAGELRLRFASIGNDGGKWTKRERAVRLAAKARAARWRKRRDG